MADKGKGKQKLDTSVRSTQVERFETELLARIIGQDQAISEIVESFVRLTSGIRNPQRPIITNLFLGPTGVGKTETIKVLAQTLFGDPRAFTRINCQEFSSPHQVAKLLGAPPGYVGGDIEPVLSQQNIDRFHKKSFEEKTGIFRRGMGHVDRFFTEENQYLSIILFDEVEKADPVLWNSILGILDDGHLTLGNNSEVDFTRAIIILTSNVGSREMSHIISGGIGFGEGEEHQTVNSNDVEAEAIKAARKIFPYEFLNRFDSTVVFSSLEYKALYQILDIMIDDLHRRLLETEAPFILECSKSVRKFLVDKGFDPQFGARPLRRVVEREMITPLSNLLATDQIKKGDFITTHISKGKIVFERETRNDKKFVTASSG